MVPTGLRHPSLAYIDNTFTADDFVSNLVLYVPLGIALSGSSLIRAFLVGLSLSTSGEVLQLGYVGRVPSFFDIAANTCGAVGGYLIPSSFGKSIAMTGGPQFALAIFLVFYGACLGLTWWFYLRRSPQGEGAPSLAEARV